MEDLRDRPGEVAVGRFRPQADGVRARLQRGLDLEPPPGIWEEATFGTKRYKQDKGDALWRRSLYVFWRRIVGPTMFFDTQSRTYCVVKPTRTNTPLHALATLNDTTYVEAARKLAERRDLDAVFLRVLARAPRPEERAILTAACVGRGESGWLEGLRERARARTGGRQQSDSADLIAEGRDAR